MIPDFICIPTGFLKYLNASHILTYFALLLAFLGYRKSIKDKYISWKLLINSLKCELDAQEPWLSTPYSNQHKDKNFYSPYKIVFKLSFESAKEIARSGISVFNKIDNELNKYIAQFNERVDTFNAFLDYHRNIFASNSLLAEILFNKLNDLGLNDDKVSYDDFELNILRLKNNSKLENRNMFLFSKQIYHINMILHFNIIGNNSNQYSLNYLYLKLKDKVNNIINNYDNNIPWFLKKLGLIIIIFLSFILLIMLEYLFK